MAFPNRFDSINYPVSRTKPLPVKEVGQDLYDFSFMPPSDELIQVSYKDSLNDRLFQVDGIHGVLVEEYYGDWHWIGKRAVGSHWRNWAGYNEPEMQWTFVPDGMPPYSLDDTIEQWMNTVAFRDAIIFVNPEMTSYKVMTSIYAAVVNIALDDGDGILPYREFFWQSNATDAATALDDSLCIWQGHWFNFTMVAGPCYIYAGQEFDADAGFTLFFRRSTEIIEPVENVGNLPFGSAVPYLEMIDAFR